MYGSGALHDLNYITEKNEKSFREGLFIFIFEQFKSVGREESVS